MSGGYSGMSLKLASYVVNQDWTHSIMSAYSGSNDEDLNMGKWVDYAIRKHNVSVNYAAESKDILLGHDDDSLVETCSEAGYYKRSPDFFHHDLCIVTVTGADFFKKRQCQRDVCRPEYGNIPHKFIVGLPSDVVEEDPIKNANESASARDIEVAGKIVSEHERFGDILTALHKDYYIDLPEKRMAVLKFGVDNKCAYTIKVDDEFCVNVTTVRQMISVHEKEHPDKEFYFGYAGWAGNEYAIMRGPDGKYVPYYSGWGNGASYNLASYIVNEDWTHTVMRANYGSSSEDVDMGFWVDYAMKKHNLKVHRAGNRAILRAISEGECRKRG